MFKLLERRK